jgi:hypothetical protein
MNFSNRSSGKDRNDGIFFMMMLYKRSVWLDLMQSLHAQFPEKLYAAVSVIAKSLLIG